MGLGWAILALFGAVLFGAALCGAAGSARAADNLGLGPLSIRNQFPVTLGFLTYTPDAPGTLRDGDQQLRYQYALTNTFVTTQSTASNHLPTITAADVIAGLSAANFPGAGYGIYLDMETTRHLLRWDYGLSDSLEVGLELAWLRFGGGFLDSNIKGVERIFGGLNEDRLEYPDNRFDFYVFRDGTAIVASSDSGATLMQDPVLNLKWNVSEGGDVLPALTLKVSYKWPLQSQPGPQRVLVSSGGADYGYQFMIAKAVGSVVGHIQWGTTKLDVQPNTFEDRLRHRMFGLEFRIDRDRSFVLQSVTQTSIFLRTATPGTIDFDISRFSDVLVIGYKSRVDGSLLEWGMIEDYNQLRNEADITFYFEVGWQW